jgi:Flp pilus assembly pilin Flp
MAEYAVVLAVITVATVAVFTALSGGISGAITSVTSILQTSMLFEGCGVRLSRRRTLRRFVLGWFRATMTEGRPPPGPHRQGSALPRALPWRPCLPGGASVFPSPPGRSSSRAAQPPCGRPSGTRGGEEDSNPRRTFGRTRFQSRFFGNSTLPAHSAYCPGGRASLAGEVTDRQRRRAYTATSSIRVRGVPRTTA